MKRLPFINALGGVPGPSGTLVSGAAGYGISLRGLKFTCWPAASVSGPAKFTVSSLFNVTSDAGGSNSGLIEIWFLPSETEFQYFTYEFPEGTAGTQGLPADSALAPASLNWTLTTSDTLTIDVNYWGQLIPV